MFKTLNKQLQGLVDKYGDLHSFYQENRNLIVSNDLKIKDVLSTKQRQLDKLVGGFYETLEDTVPGGATITNIEFNSLLEKVFDARRKYFSLKQKFMTYG